MKKTCRAPLKTILLVDDQDASRITAKWFLTHFGYDVDSVRTAEDALILFDEKNHDLIITHNSMVEMSGVEMSHLIKGRSPTTPIILHTGNVPADRSCLDLVLQTPTDLLSLKDAVDDILGAQHDLDTHPELRHPGSAIIVDSSHKG